MLNFKGSRDRSRASFFCAIGRDERFALGKRRSNHTLPNYALVPVVPVMMMMVGGVIGVEVAMAIVVTVVMMMIEQKMQITGARLNMHCGNI
jgi:hypothetical protein